VVRLFPSLIEVGSTSGLVIVVHVLGKLAVGSCLVRSVFIVEGRAPIGDSMKKRLRYRLYPRFFQRLERLRAQNWGRIPPRPLALGILVLLHFILRLQKFSDARLH
jgi:hypothetical protein